MASSDPSTNGDFPPKSDSFEMNLEPVDSSELNLGEVPTVEVAVLPRRGFGFWKALLWCLLFLVVTQVLTGILVAVGILTAMFFGTEIKADSDILKSSQGQTIMQIALVVDQLLTVGFSLFVLRWIVGKNWQRKIALRLPSVEHVMLILIALPALFVVAGAAEEIVSRYIPSLSRLGMPAIEDFMNQTKSWSWMVAVLLIGVGPAIGEELWCRGFLGQGLAGRYGNWGAVLLASFFFGLIHVEPPQATMAFLMGLVLHLTYLATRSILAPMLIHFVNNTLAILAISDTGRLPILETLDNAYQHRPVIMLTSSLIMLSVAGLALYHSRVRNWMAEGGEVPQALYPHVETPSPVSANKAIAGQMSVLEVAALIVAVSLFAALWFGV